MDSTKTLERYAVLVINTRERQGLAANTLAESLFSRLKKIDKLKRHLSTVSIGPAKPDSAQAFSWVVDIVTSKSIKKCLIEEFCFPPTQGLKARDFLIWIMKTPLRVGAYLSKRLPDIWRDKTSTGHKISGMFKIAREIFIRILDTLFYVYFIPVIAFIVIGPLRRMGNMALYIFLYAQFFLVVALTWEDTLVPFIIGIDQLTHQVVDIINDSELEFEILFPVLAGAAFGGLLAVSIVLARILKWIIRIFTISEETSPHSIGELSYLLQPLYAAEIRSDLERKLIDLNKAPNIKRICVVCEHTGALLTYEVVSRICRQKISTPISFLTRNLYLPGKAKFPLSSFWLLIDPIDWAQFSEPTPIKLSWHHLHSWPNVEYTVRLTHTTGDRITRLQVNLKKLYWFKGANTILMERLITSLNI